MSINPVSDLILDVANAAEPAQALAASEKLARLRSGDTAVSGDFSTALGEAKTAHAAGVGSQTDVFSEISAMSAGAGHAQTVVGGRAKAYKGLEQLILQRLVETMLPKESAALFGHGTAGDIWRSMLAEQLAAQMGKSVNLGLDKAASSKSGSIAAVTQASTESHYISPTTTFHDQRS